MSDDNDRKNDDNVVQLPVNLRKAEAASFEEAARPLIRWLCENGHPRKTVIVTQTTAELLEIESELTTGEIYDYMID